MSKQSSRGKDWELIRQEVLKVSGWVCAYCGKHLEGADATVDHILPKNAGGTDDLSNLIASCRKCNSAKQDKHLTRVLWLRPELFKGMPPL